MSLSRSELSGIPAPQKALSRVVMPSDISIWREGTQRMRGIYSNLNAGQPLQDDHACISTFDGLKCLQLHRTGGIMEYINQL